MLGLKDLRDWLEANKDNSFLRFRRECFEKCVVAGFLNNVNPDRIHEVFPHNIHALSRRDLNFERIDPKIILDEINVHELLLFARALDRELGWKPTSEFIYPKQALEFLNSFSSSKEYLTEYPQGIGHH